MFQISILNIGYVLPDGTHLFRNLNFSIQQEKVGLVGDNGSGKTSLLRLIQGLVLPASGQVQVDGKLAVVRQVRSHDLAQQVDEFLGVAPRLRALFKVLAGIGTAQDLALLDDDWDLEARIQEVMAQAGLAHIQLDRRLHSLSGGELSRLALAAAWLRNPDFILLDEPTNHLDADSRARLCEMVRATRAGILVASHDRGLLREMDAIVELSPRGLHRYGGNYDAYRTQKDREQAAAREQAGSRV